MSCLLGPRAFKTLTDVYAYAAAAQALGAVTRPEQTATYGGELERLSAAE
jgi:hypothetical protein